MDHKEFQLMSFFLCLAKLMQMFKVLRIMWICTSNMLDFRLFYEKYNNDFFLLNWNECFLKLCLASN